MMKALILAPDNYQQGIFTLPRGEGLWTVNVATLLTLAGYEVDFIGLTVPVNDEYKDRQPVGINWSRETLDEVIAAGKRYDVYFCHFPIHIENKPIWNKVYSICDRLLVGTWWPWAAKDWPTKWNTPLPDRTGIVTPFRGVDDIVAVPLGHIDQLGSSAFSKKRIVWTCKRPMTNDRGNDKFRTNLYHLYTSYEMALLGYPVDILCGGQDFIFNTPDAPPVDKLLMDEALHYWKALKQLPNVTFQDYMPLDKFFSRIQAGSITFPLDCSSAIPHTVLFGQVPLLWTDWGMEFTQKPTLDRLGARKHYGGYNKEEVFSRVQRLLTDESYYNNQLEIIREGCPVFTTEQAINNLKKAINVSI